MQTRFRIRRRAHKAFEAACIKHRRTIEQLRGGRTLFARVRTEIRKVDGLFAHHLDAVIRDHARAQERLAEYRQLRTTFTHIARITRIAARRDPKCPALSSPPRASTLDLLSWGEGVLPMISNVADILEGCGLPAHVLQDLPRRIETLRQVQSARSMARIDHVVANTRIQEVLRETDDAILSLETHLATTPGVSPRILAELREAKRVGRKRSSGQRPRKSTRQPPPPNLRRR
jgi:hypothetical protein